MIPLPPGHVIGVPRPAATVVVLRAGRGGPEVLLVRRHGKSGFMANATVFPGGKVDEVDRDAPAAGMEAEDCAVALRLEDRRVARAFFVGGVRELHEETGLLLARNRAGELPDPEWAERVRLDVERARVEGHVEAQAWHAVLAAHALLPALDLLHPYAHWCTPAVEPRRFDTYFFCVRAPEGQRAVLDAHETTALSWLRPLQAVEAHERGEDVELPPPTLDTLIRLDLALRAGRVREAADIDALLERWAGDGPGALRQPVFLPETEDGVALVLPEDAAHPDGLAEADARYRFVLRDGRFFRVVH